MCGKLLVAYDGHCRETDDAEQWIAIKRTNTTEAAVWHSIRHLYRGTNARYRILELRPR